MDLRRLRYFVAVAECLHFGRAAKQLHMAQPPLSQQIRQFESDLGVQLFERTTRRVALTDAGSVLLPFAKRTLAAADDAWHAVQAVQRGERGTLRVAFVDSAAFDVMPRFLRSCRERFPDVEFRLGPMSSDQQHDALAAGEIDLGIARVARSGFEVVGTRILDERLLLAVPSSHELAGRDTVPLSVIEGQQVVGFQRTTSPSLFSQLVALLAARGVAFDPVIEATEYVTMLGLVASGEGVAIVPASVRSFVPPGLTYVEFSDADARTSLQLLRRAGSPSMLVERCSELVTELFAGPVE